MRAQNPLNWTRMTSEAPLHAFFTLTYDLEGYLAAVYVHFLEAESKFGAISNTIG